MLQIKHQYVDEAGDPVLFSSTGQPIVGTEGCSRYFMVGRLEVEQPDVLSHQLTGLRNELLTDPYFVGVESFRPERKKTALQFHAKDDVPEVRYLVLHLLRAAGEALHFQAVVCDKQALLRSEIAKRGANPGYRYQPDSVYDDLMSRLFAGVDRSADQYEVCVAKRGTRDRNEAIQGAIERAETQFEEFHDSPHARASNWSIVVSNPKDTVCLQAADYFLWAVQRFYELRKQQSTGNLLREDRFLNTLWPQIALIHDLDFGPSHGTRFTQDKPLLLKVRFG